MFILPPPSFSFKVVLPSPPSLSSDTSSSPDFVISPLYWLYPTIHAHSPPLKSPFLLSASEGTIDYIFTHKALELETTHERGCEIYSVHLPATFFRDKYYSIDKNGHQSTLSSPAHKTRLQRREARLGLLSAACKPVGGDLGPPHSLRSGKLEGKFNEQLTDMTQIEEVESCQG